MVGEAFSTEDCDCIAELNGPDDYAQIGVTEYDLVYMFKLLVLNCEVGSNPNQSSPHSLNQLTDHTTHWLRRRIEITRYRL